MIHNGNKIIRYLVAFLILTLVVIIFAVPSFNKKSSENRQLSYAQATYQLIFDSDKIVDQNRNETDESKDDRYRDGSFVVLGILAGLSLAATLNTGILQLIQSLNVILVHLLSVVNTVVLIIVCNFLKSKFSILIGIKIILSLSVLLIVLLIVGLMIALHIRRKISGENKNRRYSLPNTVDRVPDDRSQEPEINIRNDFKKHKKGQIIGLSGMFKGAKFQIDGQQAIVFGRDVQNCHVVFDHNCPLISRRHCAIRFIEASDSYSVLDYSKYGTFTEQGQKLIPNSSVILPRGTIIYLGNKENMFQLE